MPKLIEIPNRNGVLPFSTEEISDWSLHDNISLECKDKNGWSKKCWLEACERKMKARLFEELTLDAGNIGLMNMAHVAAYKSRNANVFYWFLILLRIAIIFEIFIQKTVYLKKFKDKMGGWKST